MRSTHFALFAAVFLLVAGACYSLCRLIDILAAGADPEPRATPKYSPLPARPPHSPFFKLPPEFWS